MEPAGDYKDADHLDVDGLPHVGALIWPGETTHCTRDVVTSRYRAKKLKVGTYVMACACMHVNPASPSKLDNMAACVI